MALEEAAGRRRGFVTAGTWCVDRNKLIEHWPSEDSLVEILATEQDGGGPGYNLGSDIRLLDPDIPVETIGVVGADDDGRFLLAAADARGIGRRQLHVIDGEPTQYTDAYGSRRSGRRTHIYQLGVARRLCPDHFDLEAASGRIFHLGLPGMHALMDGPWQGDANGWLTVLRRARAAGFLTNVELASLPPARLRELMLPCLPALDYLIVNDSEIGALGGGATVEDGRTDVDACMAAARRVLAQGVGRLVVVHFPKGAVAVAADGSELFHPSVQVPPDAVAAANGAGDAFAAGMLYGLHQDWPLRQALALAHACAAASLRSISTTGAVESWRACLALAESWGWRSS